MAKRDLAWQEAKELIPLPVEGESRHRKPHRLSPVSAPVIRTIAAIALAPRDRGRQQDTPTYNRAARTRSWPFGYKTR